MRDDIFYVHLSEPIEIRKSILEGSKQLVQLLQRYEKIKTMRVQKTEQISKLKKIFQEITVLMNKLKQELPKTKLRIKRKQESVSPVKKTSIPKGMEIQP